MNAAAREKLRVERARRERALADIRRALEEEPSPESVRAASRRWCAAVRAIASDVVDQRQQAV